MGGVGDVKGGVRDNTDGVGDNMGGIGDHTVEVLDNTCGVGDSTGGVRTLSAPSVAIKKQRIIGGMTADERVSSGIRFSNRNNSKS